MKVKTSELSGVALDWAVAKVEGVQIAFFEKFHWVELPCDDRDLELGEGGATHEAYRPSSNWAQGGPIIEREYIAISALPDGLCRAYAPGGTQWVPHGELDLEVFKWTHKQEGYTPLIAAMRCYVASKLGDEVDVPEELCS